MCSYETYINESNCKLYYSNDTVGISLNIKDITLVTYTIYTIKSLLHISKASLMAALYNICPNLERKKIIRMDLSKLFQCFFCKNPHTVTYVHLCNPLAFDSVVRAANCANKNLRATPFKG